MITLRFSALAWLMYGVMSSKLFMKSLLPFKLLDFLFIIISYFCLHNYFIQSGSCYLIFNISIRPMAVTGIVRYSGSFLSFLSILILITFTLGMRRRARDARPSMLRSCSSLLLNLKSKLACLICCSRLAFDWWLGRYYMPIDANRRKSRSKCIFLRLNDWTKWWSDCV